MTGAQYAFKSRKSTILAWYVKVIMMMKVYIMIAMIAAIIWIAKTIFHKKIRVIFDMDGTLNHWVLGTPFSRVCESGYMRERTPQNNVIGAARLLSYFGVECWILSAVLPLSHAIPDKDYWNDIFVPFIPKERRLYIEYGKNKTEALKELGFQKGDVFLDDYTKNLNEVRTGTNGVVTCVKCVTEVNDTHRSWDGLRIEASDWPEKIAYQLARASI